MGIRGYRPVEAWGRAAPEDYDSFFRLYRPYVLSLVRLNIHLGGATYRIPDDYVGDVAHNILVKFMEHGLLEQYDPAQRPFKVFLRGFVLPYIPGQLDKIQRVRRRELLITDSPDWYDDSLMPWFDVVGGVVEFEDDLLEALSIGDLLAQLRVYLTTVTARSVDGLELPDMAMLDLYDLIIAQVREFDEIDIELLRLHSGVSSTTIHKRVFKLRCLLAQALGRPQPKRRARRTRAEMVEAA